MTHQILADDFRELLSTTSEALLRKGEGGFMNGLDEIAGLLGGYDPAPSPLLNALDHKAGDLATYFFASYSDTRDIDKSILVYSTVRSLVRYVLLIDRFYEVGNKKYKRLAKGVLRSARKMQDGHLEYCLDYLLERSWPFMDFEQLVKRRMLNGNAFTFKEVQHYSLLKASDAPMIYAQVLQAELPGFNQNVASILHYNQALQDLYDDFEDIEEDVQDKMPNIFVMASTEHIPFSRIVKNPNHARKLVASNGVADSILSLVEDYNKMIKDVTLPQNFAFLKYLSRDYMNRVLEAINVLPR
jgi:hypothetical protein